MSDLNTVVVQGHLAAKPELKYAASGNAWCRVSVAVNMFNKKENSNVGHFFNVSMFGKTAEFVSKYFDKGSPILIQGQLTQDKWTDKDGNKRYSVSIFANRVFFAGKKNGDTRPNANTDSTPIQDSMAGPTDIEPPEPSDIGDDNIPF